MCAESESNTMSVHDRADASHRTAPLPACTVKHTPSSSAAERMAGEHTPPAPLLAARFHHHPLSLLSHSPLHPDAHRSAGTRTWSTPGGNVTAPGATSGAFSLWRGVRGWVFVFVFVFALAAMTAEDAESEVVSRDLCMSAFGFSIAEGDN